MLYSELQCSEAIHKAVERMGFAEMTEVQEKTIPVMLAGRDVIAKAPTGTGKTCAFGIPVAEHIDPALKAPQAVILAPTRELAQQIAEELTGLTYFMPEVQVVCVYGGANMEKQAKRLAEGCQIVVATPGRLMDHYKHHNIDLDHVTQVVLDEADEMLNMGFYKDVKHIIGLMKARKSLSMFSATISREVMDIGWLLNLRKCILICDQCEIRMHLQNGCRDFRCDRSGKCFFDDIRLVFSICDHDDFLCLYDWQDTHGICLTRNFILTLKKSLVCLDRALRQFHTVCIFFKMIRRFVKTDVSVQTNSKKLHINTTGCFYDLVIFPADFLTVKIFSVWNENVVFPYIYMFKQIFLHKTPVALFVVSFDSSVFIQIDRCNSGKINLTVVICFHDLFICPHR